MVNSRSTSHVLFAVSLAFLGLAITTRFYPLLPGGSWRDDPIGTSLGAIPVVDVKGAPLEIKYPAMIYFFRANCRFCTPAADRLNRYVGAEMPTRPRVYAVTIDNISDGFRSFEPSVTVARLEHGASQLAFVTEVPMIVATDESGIVRRAFVGVPGRRAWEKLYRSGVSGATSMLDDQRAGRDDHSLGRRSCQDFRNCQ